MKKNCFQQHKKLIILMIIFGLLAAALSSVLCLIYVAKPNREIIFTVNAGQGTRKVAASLQSAGAIKSAWAFDGFVYANHWYLQSGVYKITPQMSMINVAEMIHSGKVQEYLVTIPEGYRVTQIDDLLSQKGIIVKGSFTKIAKVKEGYLFPDTYRFPLNVTPIEIENAMTINFDKKTTDLKIDNNTIILASIVEREARKDVDRPKIASVYLNRLKIGMKLDADPTIQYGKGSWAQISKSDYQNFQSSYNTYLVAGLPPTPICNPGIKSIEAVLAPAQTDYFYFFTTTDGQTIYSKTYDEHLANLKKYSK